MRSGAEGAIRLLLCGEPAHPCADLALEAEDGLSESTELLAETLRPWVSNPSHPASTEEAQKLFFLRENIRSLSVQLEKGGQLENRTVQRSRAVLKALEPLGNDAAGIPAPEVSNVAKTLIDLLTGFTREDEARHRISKGKTLPHPLYAGRDALTGRVQQLPQRPRARMPQETPLPPLEGEALLAALAAGTDPRQNPSGLRLQPTDAAVAPPTSADLASTLDIRFSAELQAKVDALEGDPIQLFQWVQQNVAYRIYAGSVYGSQGTLQGLAGNDVDQASLLIGLLRLAGIPARYETGSVLIPVAEVPGLTGIQDLTTAATTLTTQGIPATVIYQASQPIALKLQRTWVRAYLPYSNYRGTQASSASAGQAQWVALDPAFKRYALEQDVNLSGKVSFNLDAFVSAPTSVSPRLFFEDELRRYIASSGTRCETLEQAELKRRIGIKAEELLPVKLPYEVQGTPVSATSLTSAQRFTLSVEAADSYGFTLFNRTVSFPELYGKRLSMTFPSGSTIYSAQKGSLKPTLALDTTVLATASTVSAGTEVLVYVGVKGPNRSTTYHDHNLTAGGSYAINAWIGPVPAPLVAAAENTRRTLLDTGAPQNQVELATAYAAGLTYHQTLVEDDDHLYAVQGWLHFTELEALTGADMSPIYVWGIPYGVEPAGYVVDAENLFFSAPLRGTRNASTAASLAQLSGYNASFHEHALWERVVGLEALSSTNILQLARQQGQTVYFLASTADYNAIKSTLSQPSAVLSDVTQSLSAGDQVVISQRPVTRGGKTVSGYVLYDPDTGAGRYLINSTLNGGVTLEGIKAAINEVASLLGFGVRISSMANIAKGSLSDERMLLTVFAYGRPHVISLSYHSEQNQAGELGLGWSWSFGERIFENTTTGISHRLTPEGVLVPYTRQSDGTYAAPAGVRETLERGSNGWTLTYEDKRVLRFDTAGRLVSWSDRSGNQLVMSRNPAGHPVQLATASGTVLLSLTTNTEGQITQLKDGLGRTVKLQYGEGRLTSLTDPRNHTWTYSYAQGAKLLGKVEGDNVGISYGFDGDNRLIRYTTPTNGEGYFAYDHFNRQSLWTNPVEAENLYRFDIDGRLLLKVDEVGNQTTHQYQNGLLSQTEDPRGGITRYQYDSRGNLTTVTDPTAQVTQLTYDSQDRVTQRTDSSGTQSWVFDDTQRTVVHTSSDGSIEALSLNERGQVTSIERDGNSASYGYDTQGNLTGIAEPGNKSTTLQRDAIGRVIGVIGSDGTDLSIDYDAGDRPTRLELPNGGVFGATFSARGLLQSLQEPNGNTVHYAYTGEWMASATDAFGRVQRWERDGAGRVLRHQDAQGNATQYTLDAAGRTLSIQDIYGQSTEYGYCAEISSTPCDEIDRYGNLIQRTFDASGRLLSVKTPLGTTSYEYTGCANCGGGGTISAMTNALQQRTAYEYDAGGRLTRVLDALGQSTEYQYDGRGRLVGLRDAAQKQTHYERDAAGQLLQLVDALNRTTHFTHDNRGLMTEKLLPSGETTSFEYDLMGNLTEEIFDDGTRRSYEFDSANRLTHATSEAAELEYVYGDSFGRVTEVINHTLNEKIQYRYDPVSTHRAAVIRPDGTQSYVYNQYGKLISTTLPDQQKLTFVYDAFGRLSEKRYPNGLTQRDGYDVYGRLTSRLLYNSLGSVIGGHAYTYDALGRRLSSTDYQGVKRTYVYDAVGRLIEEKTGTDTLTYTYDEVGNRLSTLLNGVVKTLYSYDDAHQLESSQEGGITTTYTYNEDGQLESSSSAGITLTYLYDPAGQLLESRRNGTLLHRYEYDAQGRRVSLEDSNGKRHLLYDQEDTLVELDQNGNVLRGFAHGDGLDEPLAQLNYDSAPGTWFYHTDAIGSVVAVSGASGGVVQRFSYSAFGEQQAQGTLDTAFTYAGRPYDAATGTYDFRARQLDPKLGRFNTPDPLTPAAFEQPNLTLASTLTRSQTSVASMLSMPQWMSPFAYAGNDPVNWVDTLGQFILCDSQPSAFWSWIIGAGMVGAGIFVAFLGGLILAIAGLILAIWSFGCQLNMINDAEGLTEDQRSMIRGFALLIFILTAIIAIAGIWLGSVGVFVAFALLITFYTIVMGLFIEVFINLATWSNRRFDGL